MVHYLVCRFDVLIQVTRFTGLVGLPIKPGVFFFLVYDPFNFFIFLFHSYLILSWSENKIHDFFLNFYKILRSQIKIILSHKKT